MARELHTADEIRAEVKRLFDPHGAMRKRMPKPQLLAVDVGPTNAIGACRRSRPGTGRPGNVLYGPAEREIAMEPARQRRRRPEVICQS
jgi:hypothetical protein